MSIPLPTTKIQLLSPTAQEGSGGENDWGGAPDPTTGYSESGPVVRAHLSAPSGSQSSSPDNSFNDVTYRLICDPCDIKPDMQVLDLGSGVTYTVTWCQSRPGPMPHVVAGLSYVTATP